MKSLAVLLLTALSCFAQGFSDASAPFLMSTSSLRKGLVGYWRLEGGAPLWKDESSTGNNFASSNSVGTAAGKVGNCATFVSASSKYLVGQTSLLHLSTSSEFACWVNLTNKAASKSILAKNDGTVGGSEFMLYYDQGTDRFIFAIYQGTTNTVSVSANSFGSPSLNTWYFVNCWLTSSSSNIQINGGSTNTAAYSGTINNTSTLLMVGARNATTPSLFWSGSIDEIGAWNRNLSASEKSRLYNSGAGTHFPWAHP